MANYHTNISINPQLQLNRFPYPKTRKKHNLSYFGKKNQEKNSMKKITVKKYPKQNERKEEKGF